MERWNAQEIVRSRRSSADYRCKRKRITAQNEALRKEEGRLKHMEQVGYIPAATAFTASQHQGGKLGHVLTVARLDIFRDFVRTHDDELTLMYNSTMNAYRVCMSTVRRSLHVWIVRLIWMLWSEIARTIVCWIPVQMSVWYLNA